MYPAEGITGYSRAVAIADGDGAVRWNLLSNAITLALVGGTVRVTLAARRRARRDRRRRRRHRYRTAAAARLRSRVSAMLTLGSA
jgi:hypothetical protein